MKKYKKVLKKSVSDIICDACGASCIPNHEICDVSFAEFATLKAEWGYFSGMDGESHDMDFCETCFHKILAFVKTIGQKLD